jgi:hypothetical protein
MDRKIIMQSGRLCCADETPPARLISHSPCLHGGLAPLALYLLCTSLGRHLDGMLAGLLLLHRSIPLGNDLLLLEGRKLGRGGHLPHLRHALDLLEVGRLLGSHLPHLQKKSTYQRLHIYS